MYWIQQKLVKLGNRIEYAVKEIYSLPFIFHPGDVSILHLHS